MSEAANQQADATVADSAFSRRLRTLSIPTHTWGKTFAHDWAAAFLTLPPDTRILDIVKKDYEGTIGILVQSREFEAIPPMSSIPEMLPTMERHLSFGNGDVVAYTIKGWEITP